MYIHTHTELSWSWECSFQPCDSVSGSYLWWWGCWWRYVGIALHRTPLAAADTVRSARGPVQPWRTAPLCCCWAGSQAGACPSVAPMSPPHSPPRLGPGPAPEWPQHTSIWDNFTISGCTYKRGTHVTASTVPFQFFLKYPTTVLQALCSKT